MPARVAEYATPTVPLDNAVVVMDGTAGTVMLAVADLALFAAEVAVTVTVKADVPPAGAL